MQTAPFLTEKIYLGKSSNTIIMHKHFTNCLKANKLKICGVTLRHKVYSSDVYG